jgi:hypothetical protein
MLDLYCFGEVELWHNLLLLFMSLVQPEDYLNNSLGLNHYWNELLRTVDEFDQLIELGNRLVIQKNAKLQHVSKSITKEDFNSYANLARLKIACDMKVKFRRKKYTSLKCLSSVVSSRIIITVLSK